MTQSTATMDGAPVPQPPARVRTAAPRRINRDLWTYISIALVVVITWWVSRLDLFSAGSDAGYWLGVAGGVAMLVLFVYPMRKRLRFMQHWGAGKKWFNVHIVFGVAGPTLILLHSTYRIGSVNAGVALISMVIVAVSGIVGRVLYIRLHRGLHGQKTTLAELQQALGTDAQAAKARLRFAPEVAAALASFESRFAHEDKSAPGALMRAMWVVPMTRWRTERHCHHELRVRMMAVAQSEGWSRSDFRRRLRLARRLVSDYLATVQRVAQFSAWQRLFALWHVAHVPFVYLLVLSSIVHIIAVHAY